jgi:chromosome segregation ATPase
MKPAAITCREEVTMTPTSRIFIAAWALLLLAHTPSWAQRDSQTGEVLQEIGYLIKKKKDIEGRRDLNVDLKREIEEGYADLAVESDDIDRVGAAYEADSQVLEAEINQYNSYCTGTFDEEEYQRRTAWCGANSPGLNQRINVMEQRRIQINSRIDTYSRRLDDLNRKDSERIDEAQSLYAEYQEVEQRLEQLEGILRLSKFADRNQDCAAYASLESMHQCMQAIWDGARE